MQQFYELNFFPQHRCCCRIFLKLFFSHKINNPKKIWIIKNDADKNSGHHQHQRGSSGHGRNKSSSVNNCYLSGNSNVQHQTQQQQQQYQQQNKPLSISANNFSPASNTTNSFSDNSKTLYKSSSHNINTGGTCDKNYQQQATQQQQLYGSSSKNGNSYLSHSTPSTHFDFEHMLNEPNVDSQNHHLNKSHNTTASGSSRSSRQSYQANQASANSDQFQGLFLLRLKNT